MASPVLDAAPEAPGQPKPKRRHRKPATASEPAAPTTPPAGAQERSHGQAAQPGHRVRLALRLDLGHAHPRAVLLVDGLAVAQWEGRDPVASLAVEVAVPDPVKAPPCPRPHSDSGYVGCVILDG